MQIPPGYVPDPSLGGEGTLSHILPLLPAKPLQSAQNSKHRHDVSHRGSFQEPCRRYH